MNRKWVGFTLAICLWTAVLAGQSPINYIYDDLGRLIGVIDQSGNSAVYHYDAVGNVTSIDRFTSTQIAVIVVAPSRGSIGTTVTIRGSGFSTTPGNNTVSFNGTSATVSSASASQLVVTVPTGATTGTVAVTSPAGSASSPSPFVVTTNLTPTITSFSPTTGLAGTSVTITGTNFDTLLPNDRTRFNVAYAQLGSGSSTSLTGTVPGSTGSGRISVTTPYGTVTSTSDFIIPPAPYGTADVATAARLPFATATTVSIGTANRIGLMLFDGTSGQRVSLRGTNGMTGQIFGCDVLVSLLNPNGTALTMPVCMEGTGFIDATTLIAPGTYTVLVDPGGTATGNVTLTAYDVPADTTSTITAGSPVTVSPGIPGQNAKLTFSGTAGQRVSLTGTNGLSGQVLGCDVNVSVLNPDGSQLVAPACMEGSGFIDATSLPSSGTYTIKMDPVDAATGSLTLTLYNVPADTTGSITAGSPETVTSSAPGQNGTRTFSGTSGQRISLRGTNGISGQVAFACDVNVTILKPNGTPLAPATCMEGSGFLDVTTLDATGTYTVKVDPAGSATGSVTLTLYDVPADQSASVSIGGSPATLTTTVPGQNGSVTFSGTASQQVTVHVTSNSMGWVTVKLLKPDGSILTSTLQFLSSFNLSTQTLPSTGTYTILIDPDTTNTGSITVNVTTP
jgi:YD repeat-containing protein